MPRALVLAIVAACGSTAAPTTTPTPPPPPPAADHVTVPLHVEGNRPFVDLTFKKPDGSTKTARFLVDSGGGGFLIVEPLAKELGLTLGDTMREEGRTFAKVTSPVDVAIDRFALAPNPERVLVLVGTDDMLPPAAPGHADGMLPGHVLAKYHVVFDYPDKAFTIAKPGALAPRGTALPMPVHPESGFPRTEIEIAGQTYGMLLDTGASYTMMSQAVVSALGDAHRDWKRYPGAHGDAATLGGQTLETLIVPQLAWAGRSLADAGMVAQQAGAFEKWMSSMMTAPIVGALAGNVLVNFRVELDYPNQKLYVGPST